MNTKTVKKKTHRRSRGSLLSGGTRGTHGHIPIKRTNCSTCPLHWVGKGWHLLQHHFLTNLDHVLSREGRALWTNHYHIHHWRWPNCGTCNMELQDRACWSRAVAASQRKCSERMKPTIFPEAHYGFIARLNKTLAVSHYWLHANEKLFKCVFWHWST